MTCYLHHHICWLLCILKTIQHFPISNKVHFEWRNMSSDDIALALSLLLCYRIQFNTTINILQDYLTRFRWIHWMHYCLMSCNVIEYLLRFNTLLNLICFKSTQTVTSPHTELPYLSIWHACARPVIITFVIIIVFNLLLTLEIEYHSTVSNPKQSAVGETVAMTLHKVLGRSRKLPEFNWQN